MIEIEMKSYLVLDIKILQCIFSEYYKITFEGNEQYSCREEAGRFFNICS
jgi:hypothetical protein